jgi:predicted PurR-regulated permease PerM
MIRDLLPLAFTILATVVIARGFLRDVRKFRARIERRQATEARDHSDRFNSELTPETQRKLTVQFLKSLRKR